MWNAELGRFVYPNAPKDWDALDQQEPYTVVSMLSWAITSDLITGTDHVMRETIKSLSNMPEMYRW